MKTEANDNVYPLDKSRYTESGITKRELFSAMFMQGYLSCNPTRMGELQGVAENSVVAADELIKSLNRNL